MSQSEIVRRRLEHRLGARERRIGIFQRGRGIHRAAVLASIAVLVARAAVGALALDVAVGEEHALHRVVELLDRLRVDQAGRLELAKHVLRELRVLGRMRGMPVVERDMKAVEVLLAAARDFRDECFGRLAGFFRSQHDRRAVGIVGPHEMHRMALHPLEPHPDVGLDVFHEVTDVERPVGVRQGGGDEHAPRHGFGSGNLLGRREF